MTRHRLPACLPARMTLPGAALLPALLPLLPLLLSPGTDASRPTKSFLPIQPDSDPLPSKGAAGRTPSPPRGQGLGRLLGPQLIGTAIYPRHVYSEVSPNGFNRGYSKKSGYRMTAQSQACLLEEYVPLSSMDYSQERLVLCISAPKFH